MAMLINSSSLPVGAAQPTSGNQNEQVYECDGYTVTFKLETEWNSGYNAAIVIQNTGNATISDWFMYLKYDGEIPNMWNATIYDRPEHYYVLTNSGWNKDVYANGNVSFGFTGSGEFTGFPETIKVTSGYDPTALDGGDDHGDDGGDDIVDDGVDTDADGLSDALEDAIGSDPQLVDTDGDGLSDYQELYLTGTDPLLTDTDGDGTCDSDEDVDEDGLTNLDEFLRGTDVANYDSDRDDLSDYDEIHEYGTNPLIYDTDGDGLCDGDDVLLGFSPTMPDTDLNGVLDSAEKIYQSTENNFEYEDAHGLTSVSVSLDISGNIEKEIEITNVYDFDAQSREVVGIVGAPIEITSDVDFDTATISFSYDESALGDTLEENLSLMWYDEENNWYQVLDQDCVVDAVNNTVSYTTTHFSKYFLVDVSKWFSAWSEDVDYGDVEVGHEPRQVDVVFVSDDAVYVEGGTAAKICSAFWDYEYPDWANESGQVFFNEGVSAWYSIKDDYKYIFTDRYGSFYSPYHGETMASVLRSIMFAMDRDPQLYEDDEKIVVILSDGNFKISDDVINECKNYGIKIYTIDVEHGENYVNFKRMSNLTGGQYYYGEILEDPEFLWDCIVYDSGERLEGGDRDGDGLLDVYETEGMRTLTGRLIKTDAYKKDSDGDTLTDSEETGPVYDLNLYIGRGITKSVRLIVPNSDPTIVDSDGDGIPDNEDPHPMKKEKIEVALNNIYGIDYLSVGGLDGGYQGWWPDIYGDYDETIAGNWGGYYNYVLDPNYRISHFGCGLIAMTDLELYLAQQNGYYIPHNEYPYPNGGYIIDKDKYMRLVEYNRDNVYYLSDYFYNFKIGVTPVDMVRGIENFLVYNGEADGDASWMYFDEGADPIKTIERMISENIPIVFSYYVDGLKIPLYYSEENAINHLTDTGYATSTNSHYMTIIGYTKYLDPDSNHYRYVLKVVSWGKIYYINFDEYVDYMNLYTSILEISI